MTPIAPEKTDTLPVGKNRHERRAEEAMLRRKPQLDRIAAAEEHRLNMRALKAERVQRQQAKQHQAALDRKAGIKKGDGILTRMKKRRVAAQERRTAERNKKAEKDRQWKAKHAKV